MTEAYTQTEAKGALKHSLRLDQGPDLIAMAANRRTVLTVAVLFPDSCFLRMS